MDSVDANIHPAECPGVSSSRVVLYVAEDNRLCHREDEPTDEELQAWLREVIQEGDLDLRELIPLDAIEVRWEVDRA